MISTICQELKNWFIKDSNDMIHDKFTITNGTLINDIGLLDGQYYRIIDSINNDGVYQFNVDELIDEEFDGTIWKMRVPNDFVKLCKEIEVYSKEYASSPYQSESFGGYSYSKIGDGSWQSVFAKRLNRWRKI